MIEPTEKQRRALELRRQGLTWRAIGAAIGSNTRNASKLADRALLKERRLQEARN